MSLRKKFFAATYDSFSRRSENAGLRDMRHGLIAGARGSVLEVGAGTGANLTHYNGQLESLMFTEPDPAMIRRLQAKARDEAPLAKILRAPAEDLPFEDASFDTVVSTLVLCGVEDQPRSVREIRRVLKPGGRLLFIEHVRSDDPALARFQDRMNWLNRSRRLVRLQPADALHDRGFGLYGLPPRALRAPEGTEVRPAADRRVGGRG